MKKNIATILACMVLLLSACVKESPQINQQVNGPTATTQPQELTTVRINKTINLNYAPIFIAIKEGYFAEFGIELEMIEIARNNEAIPLLVSGDLDAFAGGVNPALLNSLSMTPSVRVVADRGQVMKDMDCSFMGIMIRKDLYESGAVKGPQDLKGMDIITARTGANEFLVKSYLEKGGLSLEDVNITDIPNSAYYDVMANGTVDFITTLELSLSKVINAGNAVLLTGLEDVVGDYQLSILAFGKNLLVDDPDLGARFLAAYLKGVAQYNEGKTERNLQILSEATGEEVAVLKNACWIPISTDCVPNFESIIPYMDWAVEVGNLEQVITEQQFWDPTLLEAARKLLGE